MIEAGIDDEVYVIEDKNLLINVFRLIESINSNAVEFDKIVIPIDDLLDLVLTDRINRECIRSMPPARREQPLIYINLGGYGRIIDGNHRLIRRKEDSFKYCEVLVVSVDALKNYCEPLTNRPKREYKEWYRSIFEECA
ncbi:hypothetical protein ACVBIL_08630 [Shewanella sp. 125m-7]